RAHTASRPPEATPRRTRAPGHPASEQPADAPPPGSPRPAAVPAADAERADPGEFAEKSDERRPEHDERERNAEEENPDEGRRREYDHHGILERPPADAHDRLEHDGQDRGFEPEEQRLDDRHAAPPGVD